MRKRFFALPFLLLIPLAIACSSDPEPTATTQPTATSDPATATTEPSTGTEANVSLVEWDVQLDSTSLSAGSYTFNVSNDGSMPHELVIIQTDTPLGDLEATGGILNEAAVGTVVGEVENINANASAPLNVDLDAGNYVFICNIPGHFGLGMATAVTVN